MSSKGSEEKPRYTGEQIEILDKWVKLSQWVKVTSENGSVHIGTIQKDTGVYFVHLENSGNILPVNYVISPLDTVEAFNI
jgi:hypothetical protein